MSDTSIIVISILLFFLVIFAGTAWLIFVYLPKRTLTIANELAETIKNTLGLTPQVTINQKVISKRTNEIFELAMIEQDFDVEYETSHTRMRSEKQIFLRGIYRAKIGFNLQKGFNIEIHRGGLLKRNEITLRLPHAEILSLESLDIHETHTSGLINWVTKQDIESATKQLAELAADKATKLDILNDAETRIENRLNKALLPRLVNYQLEHKVEYVETASHAISSSKENENARLLETTDTSENRERPNE
jgi:hypothetical protein